MKKSILSAILILLMFHSAQVGAATLNVPEDYPKIQHAIDASFEGCTILISDGTYTGEGNKNLDFKGKPLTLRSENGPENTTIDCEGEGRGFIFDNKEDHRSVVSGISIINGNTERGGAIYCGNATPLITNCFLSNNTADAGGALYAVSVTIENCRIFSNTARNGGAVYFTFVGSDRSQSIVDCKFELNTADDYGGAIYIADVGYRPISRCTFYRNSANVGGGIYTYNGNVDVSQSLFNENSAHAAGAIRLGRDDSSIVNCIFSKNSATVGGAITGFDANDVIANCTFYKNTATSYGGALSVSIDYSSEIPAVVNCIFWNNTPDQIRNGSRYEPELTYSCVQGGYTGVGNFHGDPLFVDPENLNFHLKTNSPCIYAGTSTHAPEMDFDGSPRPQGHGYDIGAYETNSNDNLRPVVDSFTSDKVEGHLPFDVTFSATAHDPEGTVMTYTIDYGDGSAPESNHSGNFVHTYTTTGSGDVILTVTDASGASTNSHSIYINRYGTVRVPDDYSKIQDAVDALLDGNTILVGDGVYAGTRNTNINVHGKALTIKTLNGPENCIIDCRRNGRGFIFENGETKETVISGFTIMNGNGDAETSDASGLKRGGGIYCFSASPTIENCVIKNNSGGYGGGFYCNESSAVITNCSFIGNTAQSGAGLYFRESSVTLINCQIRKNSATVYGGGIHSSYTETPTSVVNCLIADNSAQDGGGVYAGGFEGLCTITNSTITGNSAQNHGGAILCEGWLSLDISNSILWNNSPGEIWTSTYGTLSVQYSDVQGGYEGEGNISEDPKFRNAERGVYALTANSACIDTGNNDAIDGLFNDDIQGEPRLRDGDSDEIATVDMGSYEFLFSPDSDEDGLYDTEEEMMCTDPGDADTDDDGIFDGIEDHNYNGAVDIDETDPCNPDTDSDGIPDGWEVANGLNPLIDDSIEDPDEDNLTNYEEYINDTNPYNPDTDNDGVPDGDGMADDPEEDNGYNVTADLWAKAVLKSPAGDVTLRWQALGSDITPVGAQVVSGYFYADPDDFAYGSICNPEVLVKIYIDPGGWCNMAFNHVTVDNVDVFTAHNYGGNADQTRTISLSNRLAETQYTDVSIDQTLGNGTKSVMASGTNDGGYILSPGLWAKAILQVANNPVALIWQVIGSDTTPSGDRVVSGYFYADTSDFAYGSIYNPEVFVKIYIATSGWCNIAFNHVTVDNVTVYSAHQYTGTADQTATATLSNRLVEHQYNDVGGSSDMVTGQAILGPLAGATVDVYRYNDLKTSVHSTITSESSDLSGTGLFDIPSDVLEENTLYVIKITGGRDFDADQDGLFDTQPTENLGTLHLVATGAQIKSGSFKVNILTDIVYHKVAYLILARYSPEIIQADIDIYSKRLLTEDIDNNGTTDLIDLMQIDPAANKEYLSQEWSVFQSFIESVHTSTAYLDELHDIQRAIVAAVDTPNRAQGVAVSGDYAYVADMVLWGSGSSSLQVIDISNPAKPVLAGAVDTTGEARDVALSGNYAYVADGYSGLQVIDVANPANPNIMGTFDTPGEAYSVALIGNYAFVADRWKGLLIIDISDPQNLAMVSELDVSNDAVFVTVRGSHAYVVGWNDGSFAIVDISNPENPTIKSSVDMNRGESVIVSGDYAYVTTEFGGLHVLDISNPENPILVGEVDTPGFAYNVKVSGHYAYVADGEDHLQIVDISNPENPTIVSRIITPDQPQKLALSGENIYVADRLGGLQIIDANALFFAGVVGAVDTPGYKLEISASGDRLIVPGSEYQLIDITDPPNPTVMGSVDASEPTVAFEISDDIQFDSEIFIAARGYSGIRIMDVRDPEHPVFIGEFDTPGTAYNVSVSGHHAFVADGSYGLQVIDISDLANPILVGSLKTGSNSSSAAQDVMVSGNLAYVLDSGAGLQVVDVSYPSAPFIVATANAKGSYFALSGAYAYVPAENRGLQVVDLSDHTSPVITASTDLLPHGFDLAVFNISVSGNYAYVTGSNSGFQVFDIREPNNPIMVGVLDTPVYAGSIRVSNNYAYAISSLDLSVYRAIADE